MVWVFVCYNLGVMPQLLEFERGEIEPLEAEIEALRRSEGDAGDILKRVRDLEKQIQRKLRKLHAKATPWETCQVARHPQRPQALDYIGALITEFTELHGDRVFADDPAVVCGIGRFGGDAVAVVGQQKGKDTAEKLRRNFGMANPEGYRKALRMMNLAARFRLPLLTFVDTPGAYPGVGAEERGQSAAIGECLRRAAVLPCPIVATVIGEGGSGGALALAVADHVAVMARSVYSVISPEGCASILWKDRERAADAADALAMTAPRLKELRLVDEVVEEPLGGAHRDPAAAMESARGSLRLALDRFSRLDETALLEARRHKWRKFDANGKFYSELR